MKIDLDYISASLEQFGKLNAAVGIPSDEPLTLVQLIQIIGYAIDLKNIDAKAIGEFENELKSIQNPND